MKKILSILAAAALILLCSCNIQTKSQYQSGQTSVFDENGIDVKISISCKSAFDLNDPKLDFLPEGGVVLSEKTYKVANGVNVFDLTKAVCAQEKILLDIGNGEYDGTSYSFINGFANLAGGDVGKYSGWMYSVNDVSPEISCEGYELKSGDTVKWEYICGDDYSVEVSSDSTEEATDPTGAGSEVAGVDISSEVSSEAISGEVTSEDMSGEVIPPDTEAVG